MFTGLVETVGRVRSIKRGAASSVLSIEAPWRLCRNSVRIGRASPPMAYASPQRADDAGFCADVMHETLRAIVTGALSAGSAVNLERAMPANGRFGGHIVSGHIDGTGRITSTRRDDVAVVRRRGAQPSPATSLKKAPSPLTASASPWRAFPKTASISMIPHTADVTALGRKRAETS